MPVSLLQDPRFQACIAELRASGNEQAIDELMALVAKSERPFVRPQAMRGLIERVRTAYGNMYVTITFDDDGHPFEVFATLGKTGSTDSANVEAVARLISMALRSGVAPEEVVDQLRGITSEPVWDQGVLVRSAPDAVAIALSRAMERTNKGALPPVDPLVLTAQNAEPPKGILIEEPCPRCASALRSYGEENTTITYCGCGFVRIG